MRAADFDYPLPAERIAQEPLAERDASRLLHVLADGGLEDRVFTDLPALLRPGDLLVVNDTRVRRARLRGVDDDGRDVELLVLERARRAATTSASRGRRAWPPRARSSRRRRPAARPSSRSSAAHRGGRTVSFDADGRRTPRSNAPARRRCRPTSTPTLRDPERYQTVYATGEPASAAAPTAGLHFTARVLERLRGAGVGWATLRLDVGLGTFAPIRADAVEDHPMHEERYALPAATVGAIEQRARAVGASSPSAPPWCACSRPARDDGAPLRPGRGTHEPLHPPGHRFRVVDGLLTNFHQPRSSLLVLLAAFIGDERWRERVRARAERRLSLPLARRLHALLARA